MLPCAGLEFRCASGECVPLSLRCDGRPHCRDGSDEACGCSQFCSGPTEFRCDDNLCVMGRDSSPRCDGLSQCSDGSDEFSCPASSCRPGEWRCDTGLCIPSVHRCDGVSQCPDMSDEVSCPCAPGQWTCADGGCLEAQYRCDGVVHCRDYSDETECGNNILTETRHSDPVQVVVERSSPVRTGRVSRPTSVVTAPSSVPTSRTRPTAGVDGERWSAPGPASVSPPAAGVTDTGTAGTERTRLAVGYKPGVCLVGVDIVLTRISVERNSHCQSYTS